MWSFSNMKHRNAYRWYELHSGSNLRRGVWWELNGTYTFKCLLLVAIHKYKLPSVLTLPFRMLRTCAHLAVRQDRTVPVSLLLDSLLHQLLPAAKNLHNLFTLANSPHYRDSNEFWFLLPSFRSPIAFFFSMHFSLLTVHIAAQSPSPFLLSFLRRPSIRRQRAEKPPRNMRDKKP